MNASAAARVLFPTPFGQAALRQAEARESVARVLRIANILRQSGYNVAQLSNRTGTRHGNGSPYFIPPTFLYKLRSGVTPHICQIVALSESTGYRFVDWMRMFGFDLRRIPDLQVRLHAEATVLVTPVEFQTDFYRSDSDRSESESAGSQSAISGAVCGSTLKAGPVECLLSRRRRYGFAKIGRRDALLSPELVPGTIIRVDRCYRQPSDGADDSSLQRLLWLVEQPDGLTCCHVKWIDHRQIVLLPSRPPWGSLPLCTPEEAQVLGLADFGRGFTSSEISESSAAPGVRLGRRLRSCVSQSDAGYERFRSLLKFESPPWSSFGRTGMKCSELLRAARRRTGLTFRAAHQVTAAIARILDNRDCQIGLGLLSDYEAIGRLPRHIAKIISLCIAYCLDLRELLEAAGVYIDDSGKMPLPGLDSFVGSEPGSFDGAEHYRTVGLGGEHFASVEQLGRASRIWI